MHTGIHEVHVHFGGRHTLDSLGLNDDGVGEPRALERVVGRAAALRVELQHLVQQFQRRRRQANKQITKQ